MVRVGDTILICSKGYVKAKVISLFLIGQGRWLVGYEEPNGASGFFIEGDEEFPMKMINKITEVFYKLEESDYDDIKDRQLYQTYFKKMDDLKSPWAKLSYLSYVFLGALLFVTITNND